MQGSHHLSLLRTFNDSHSGSGFSAHSDFFGLTKSFLDQWLRQPEIGQQNFDGHCHLWGHPLQQLQRTNYQLKLLTVTHSTEAKKEQCKKRTIEREPYNSEGAVVESGREGVVFNAIDGFGQNSNRRMGRRHRSVTSWIIHPNTPRKTVTCTHKITIQNTLSLEVSATFASNRYVHKFYF